MAASWIARPPPAPVMRPKLVDDSVVFGLLKFTWLNALKNSPRSCSAHARAEVEVAQDGQIRVHVAGPVDQARGLALP